MEEEDEAEYECGGPGRSSLSFLSSPTWSPTVKHGSYELSLGVDVLP